jgi:hypothetical protein
MPKVAPTTTTTTPPPKDYNAELNAAASAAPVLGSVMVQQATAAFQLAESVRMAKEGMLKVTIANNATITNGHFANASAIRF